MLIEKYKTLVRPQKGRALFYTRDSSGRSEMNPGEYVQWAADKCRELGLTFTGTPQQIGEMIANKCPAQGDIFQDNNVSGNVLDRPGLTAMLAEAGRDSGVSHILIPRSDRLVRPDDVRDGLDLEASIYRDLGLWLVYMNRALPPIRRGQNMPLPDMLLSVIAHHQSGEFRSDLALKILIAQRALAERGLATGGRAPYGLCRVLVQSDGTIIRKLVDGERVRTKGQHVVWMPDGTERWANRQRIVKLLFTASAGHIARTLAAEGVPSPDAGRLRTDGGVTHAVSGVWHPGQVTAIGRDPINMALYEYGRRSTGDRYRFGPEGPRALADSDYQDGQRTPRVVVNPQAQRIRTPAKFEPLLTAEEFERLQEILDARAGTQRGKPRSRRPQENPLGARVFDMDCGWPMYRSTNHGSWKYACGLYTQSTGARCRSNHVDGAAAVRLILSCIRQRVLYPDLLAKLEARLRGMAEGEAAAHAPAAKLQKHRAELRVIEEKLKIVSGNMALATTPQRFDVVAKVFDELTAQRIALQDLIATAQRSAATAVDPAAEVAAAMAVVKRLADLASEPDSLTAAGELFAALNARLFVRFGNFPQGGRILRKPSGGFVTFGDAPPPIDVYSGRTDRRSVRSTAQAGALSAPATCDVVSTGHEGDSLGKGRRGTP